MRQGFPPASPVSAGRVVALSMALALVAIGVVLWCSRAGAQARGSGAFHAKAGTASNPVPPARLLLREVDGNVVIAAVVPPRAGACVVTRAHPVSSERCVVNGNIADGSILDAPGVGVWAYELWAKDGATASKGFVPGANAKPLATATIDLRPVESLVFLGGTAKRGLFEHVAANGNRRRFMVAVGAPIEAVMLAEVMGNGGEAPRGEVVELATGLRLISVSLLPSLSGSRTETIPETAGTNGEQPALGIDRKPLQVTVSATRRGPQRLAAVISAGRGNEKVGSRILAEGETMVLEPK